MKIVIKYVNDKTTEKGVVTLGIKKDYQQTFQLTNIFSSFVVSESIMKKKSKRFKSTGEYSVSQFAKRKRLTRQRILQLINEHTIQARYSCRVKKVGNSYIIETFN